MAVLTLKNSFPVISFENDQYWIQKDSKQKLHHFLFPSFLIVFHQLFDKHRSKSKTIASIFYSLDNILKPPKPKSFRFQCYHFLEWFIASTLSRTGFYSSPKNNNLHLQRTMAEHYGIYSWIIRSDTEGQELMT